MFIGHFAVAYAAKKAAPRTSLGTLFLGAQFIDLLWPLFLLLGWEHASVDPGNTPVTPLNFYDYPFSHSLFAVLFWGVLVGGIYFAARHYKTGAVVVGAAVISHWILDAISHRPDLPLAPGVPTYVGLGLWYFPLWTVVVEFALFVAGFLLYSTSTKPRDGIGRFGSWLLAIVLLAIYGANIAGPPPPDMMTIAIAGNLTWLFVLWAYWIDRHRVEDRAGDI